MNTKMKRTAVGGRRAGRLTEIETPEATRRVWRETGSEAGRCYGTASGCTVMIAREPARRAPAGIWLPPSERMLWHLSVAHRHRYPTWDEIADVRYELVPGEVTMALLLPPPGEYVNAHEHAFHLWQIDDRRS